MNALAWVDATEHEAALLGAMLLNEPAQDACLPRLTKDCFTTDQSKLVFQTMHSMYETNDRIDVVTLRKRCPSLTASALIDYQDACPVPNNYRHYLDAVLSDHDARVLAAGASTAAMQAAAGDADAAQGSWADSQDRLLNNDPEATVYDSERLVSTGLTIADAYMQGERAVLGVPSGFPSLDKSISGLVPGNFVVVAGRPGKGKSLFGTNLLVNVAKQGYQAALFSLEMTAQEIAMRVLCREAQVNWQLLRDGQAKDASALVDATHRLDSLPMTVVDEAKVGLGTLHSYCRRFHPEVLIVDYVQLMASGAPEGRQEEVAKVSRGLKLLAKEQHVCVVGIAQLNRNIEMRGDGASPQLSDLRDSGSLEQDSDVVAFLIPREGTALDVNVAKNRNGPASQFRLKWTRAIGDLTDELAAPPPLRVVPEPRG